MTSSASASCGIHFGETKLVISMRRSPADASASISRTFPESGTVALSFCRPSRGETSYRLTASGTFANSGSMSYILRYPAP